MDINRCFELNSSQNNNSKIERKLRETYSLYESQFPASNFPLNKDYQTYIDLYNQNMNLYLIDKNGANLIIYDTKIGRKNIQTLNYPKRLNSYTRIIQLPNDELFIFGLDLFGTAFIFDRNYRIKPLPSGAPCCLSSGIYFNGNVYCFGGKDHQKDFALSRKFDLNESRWIDLIPMPWADMFCHSLLINGNILISGHRNKNLLLYSIDINSFSTIPYEFAARKQKILINAEKLYLLEFWCGLIYESEDEYNWNQISKSIIYDNADVSYCS